MTDPVYVSRAQWLERRKDLLAEEKAFLKERDRLSAVRRSLPLVKVEKDYRFTGPEGRLGLGDLFGPHGQLAVYHFMFGPDWEEGCPSCSFWADSFDGITPHLAARDTAFVAVSNAEIGKLEAYRKRLGWGFRWVSADGLDFSEDFGVSFYSDAAGAQTQGYNYGGKAYGEEMPGVSIFRKAPDGSIGHSYSTYARGLDNLNCAYQFLDLTPKGRDEEGLPFSMAWVKRNDSYV